MFAIRILNRPMTTLSSTQNGKQEKLFFYFLIIWTIVGLIQNYFTEVSGEEAYYWLFSQFLDWSYLDHPPMVGVVTAPGYWLFPNNMGLRMGMLVTNILTIIVLRKTLEVNDDKLFIWIMLGLAPFHLGALLVKTDVPLLFFTATFFYFYKGYLKNDNWKMVLLLALNIALVMMSKYHGFLVVLFTVLSNFSLFKKQSFWAVVGLTVLFMLPHTYWQYTHDFASIKFHLYNRIDLGFRFGTILYYIGIQPLVFGPLIGVLLFGAAYKHKTENEFHRALKFNIVGVLIFFLISAFRVEVHKHWTSVMVVPLILLGHEYISNRENWRKWMIKLCVISVILFIPGRIYLMHDFLPKTWTKGWDVLHGWDGWAEEVTELSEGLPIIFINHYERASRYSYLTGNIVHCYNTYDYRETQHDLWPLEENLQGKTVFMIDRHNRKGEYATYTTSIGKGIHYRVIENFRSFRNVNVEMVDFEKEELVSGSTIELEIRISNNYDYAVDFSDVNGRQVHLNAHFLKGLTPETDEQLELLTLRLNPKQEITKKVKVKVPDYEGRLDLRFSIQVEGIEAPINGKKQKVILE